MDAKSSNKTATLTVGNKTYDFPILSGTVGPDVIDIAKLYAPGRDVHLRPRLHLDRRAASRRSPISTATPAFSNTAAIRSSSSPRTATSSRPAICCSTGSFRPPAQKKDFDHRVIHHTMVHEQMARFFQGFRRDAHPMAIMVAAVGALAAFYHDSHRHQRSEAAHDRLDAHDREGPDAGGDGLQIHRRPALHVSEELALLCRELPAHVLRGALRGIQDQPGAG